MDAYDEDPRLCTAGRHLKLIFTLWNHFSPLFCKARRPPVEETTNFLKSLLLSHGPDFLEQLFGERARNYLQVFLAQALGSGKIKYNFQKKSAFFFSLKSSKIPTTQGLGGVDRVAILLSECRTIEVDQFGNEIWWKKQIAGLRPIAKAWLARTSEVSCFLS